MLSDEQKEARQAQQSASRRQARDNRYLSWQELEDIVATRQPSFPSPEHRNALVQEGLARLQERRPICAVCDAFKRPEAARTRDILQLPDVFFKVLQVDEKCALPEQLLQQYDVSTVLGSRFKNIVLSPRGLYHDREGTKQVYPPDFCDVDPKEQRRADAKTEVKVKVTTLSEVTVIDASGVSKPANQARVSTAATQQETRQTAVSTDSASQASESKDVFLMDCDSCYKSIQSSKNKAKPSPPKFSIRNGLWIGMLPAQLYYGATATDLALISPLYNRAYIKTLRATGQTFGPGQMQLSGHSVCYTVDVQKVVTSLPLRPREFADGDIPPPLWVLVRPRLSSLQRADICRLYQAQPAVIRALLTTFKSWGNPYYKNIEVDSDALADYEKEPVPSSLVTFADEEPPASSSKQGKSHALPEVHTQSTDSEQQRPDIVEHSQLMKVGGLTDDWQPLHRSIIAEQLNMGASSASDDTKESKSFAVGTGSFFPQNDRSWNAASWPALFPFGRGGPEEDRPVPISMKAYCRHVLQLSTTRFQASEWLLHNYSAIAKDDVRRAAFIQGEIKTSSSSGGDEKQAEAFASLDPEEARRAARFQEECAAAARSSRPFPEPPADSSLGQSFFKSLQLCSKAAQHTAEFAQDARIKVHSMHNRFGKPTFWYVTSLLVL